MKTFKDLEFKPHSIPGGQQALMSFDNEYGVSVISGSMFYTDTAHPYEVAVLFQGHLTYSTTITSDVIGHCTARRVTSIMKRVQNLK